MIEKRVILAYLELCSEYSKNVFVKLDSTEIKAEDICGIYEIVSLLFTPLKSLSEIKSKIKSVDDLSDELISEIGYKANSVWRALENRNDVRTYIQKNVFVVRDEVFECLANFFNLSFIYPDYDFVCEVSGLIDEMIGGGEK